MPLPKNPLYLLLVVLKPPTYRRITCGFVDPVNHIVEQTTAIRHLLHTVSSWQPAAIRTYYRRRRRQPATQFSVQGGIYQAFLPFCKSQEV
jgi:hypothetical protein